MKLILIAITLISAHLVSAQTKNELIKSAVMDSVLQYQGEGTFSAGNCLIIKFSGDVTALFNELVQLHAQSEDQIERTTTTLTIYDTTKPYWIYGRYSVFAEAIKKDQYSLVEIYFMGYSNPNHLMIVSAPATYQKLINKLLGK